MNAHSLDSYRILVVDDDPAIRGAVGEVLADEGYRVALAEDGAEALHLITWQPPDLILLDMRMPRMNGWDFARRLKEAGLSAPTVVMTAAPDAATWADQIGANGYLAKPFDLPDLLAMTERLLRNSVVIDYCAPATCRHLDAFVATISDAVVCTTFDGIITVWNPAAERIFGFSATEVLGRHLSLILPPDQTGAEGGVLDRLQRGERVDPYQSAGFDRAGRRLFLSIGLSGLHGADRDASGAIFIARDLTEHHRREEQFQRARLLEGVGQLAGGLAHQFNNLLTIISGYAQILTPRFVETSEERTALDRIVRASDRAVELNQQLLAYSQRHIAHVLAQDLNATLKRLRRAIRALSGPTIAVAMDFEPRLGPVLVDDQQIERLILTLAENARDAMPRGGRLTIETANVDLELEHLRQRLGARIGPYVRLRIADTGVGMDDATQARIFEPFFSTKGVHGGVGLGLAAAHGIVTQAGGWIEVRSQVGNGTTFDIYLPRVTPASR